MLQELAKRVRPVGQRLVESQPSVAHQDQSGRGDHCLGEAPPWHVGRLALVGDDGTLADQNVGSHAKDYVWQPPRHNYPTEFLK